VVPFKVITANKTCTKCKENFAATSKYFWKGGKKNKLGLSSLCIPCDRLRGRVYKYKNATTLRNSGNKYINTEVGYQHDIINGIFSRGRKDPSKTKRFVWVPEITKEKIYELLQLHYIKMKKKFPDSNGRLCEYCNEPWTYIRKLGTRNQGKQKRGASIETNFSVDRLDTTYTYQEDNLVFCCSGCNNRKNQVRIEDMVNIMNVWMERNKYDKKNK
jgi:hypothetical protein